MRNCESDESSEYGILNEESGSQNELKKTFRIQDSVFTIPYSSALKTKLAIKQAWP